ncbi:DUF4394 domain-containing protein [Noviherbaspirillum cavernae]|uniref:DUF4394 domain-containing protein n=1 Tax=Noviherbaspirillum cavernae TaxID=2320862 RepID=A0A418WVA3_9BURK|nr:DUF4394 domain-containing protein [Noviherbaspirillum cavernae]RJF96491.1 DUF4394 domain-containing protein [Noviherbaspirillum cavernae]
MNKYLRWSALAVLIVSTFPVQSADDRNRNKGQSGNDNNARCESDDSRRYGTLSVVGLTEDMRLICFDENKPDKARDIGAVSGLMAGDTLVGIDYRVQDGKLYGVSKTGGVYLLDTRNAAATKVSQFTVALDGTSFGVDFNPAADRLRIVSDSGQNLRHNVNAGGVTLTDDPLDYPPATPVNATGPNASGVTGSAYTNNDLDATTATTLYALDTNLDQIALQSPPNDGTLAATGKLGADVTASVGFDIYSTVRDGVTVNVQGLASLHAADSASGLYSINLSTGKASARGSFSSQNKVIGIAIPLNQL